MVLGTWAWDLEGLQMSFNQNGKWNKPSLAALKKEKTLVFDVTGVHQEKREKRILSFSTSTFINFSWCTQPRRDFYIQEGVSWWVQGQNIWESISCQTIWCFMRMKNHCIHSLKKKSGRIYCIFSWMLFIQPWDKGLAAVKSTKVRKSYVPLIIILFFKICICIPEGQALCSPSSRNWLMSQGVMCI